MKHLYKSLPIWLLMTIMSLFVVNCQDDSYLVDGGTHKAEYDGTIMEYMENLPDKHYFSDLVKVIKYAGLDEVLNNDTVTFFAPTDWSIKFTIDYVNKMRYSYKGEDSIKDLRQIKPEVWKTYLSMYIIPGKYRLKDLPQLDTAVVSAYPGAAYYSYGGKPMNIGVEYYDANGVKYAGARQILFSYVNDFTSMDMINAYVSTCDIQPRNGVLHVLRFTEHKFGFDMEKFFRTVEDVGVLPLEEVQSLDNDK